MDSNTLQNSSLLYNINMQYHTSLSEAKSG